jgi:hypothetical protein
MRKLIYFFLLLVAPILVSGQELNCDVQINTDQIEASDKSVFETMQRAIVEFMNNRKWSSYNFKIEERIDCTILITFSEWDGADRFKANINLVLKRPVYNSSYNSTLLNYIDREFQIDYAMFQSLDFNPTVFTSNLTSVLAYYVYIFLGMDFDSFSRHGGTPFYEQAQTIVTAAGNSNAKGWKPFESQKNRYWMVENLLNAKYVALRDFLYEYHRQGLDLMYEDPAKGRAAILKSLNFLQQVKKDRPNLFMLQLILEAKLYEFINVFSEGTPAEKTEAVNLLKSIDPANSDKYDDILKN